MRSSGAFLFAAVLTLGLGSGLLAQQPASAASKTPVKMTMPMAMSMTMPVAMSMTMPMAAAAPGKVPPYHASAPKGPLPATLNPRQFADPRVQAAYAMAAQIRGVLYQQPCYCGCDTELGHKSLLDCYVGDHASICETCMMEGVFAYRETKAGKTPTQIRAEIEQGKWKSVNLNDLLAARTY